MTTRRSAPVYLDLFRIRFPVGAVTSIAHRLAGVLLILALPFLVYLLDLSLQDADGFRQASALLQTDWVKPAFTLIAWSLFHHLLAGIRFLLIDVGIGVMLAQARLSAWLVNITGVLAALLFLGWIL
ncbi:MAG: succinate dehydrogenase, cytochrome b556 subunit [Gammaproteobacteria bacterium]|nr:succinate dehydrogenase, cytochrome b556 subunit [Gammaproteobacteria bacterium]